MKRRDFLVSSVGALGLSSLVTAADMAGASEQAIGSGAPALARLLRPADVPVSKGARVIVVGGGWSGLTMAKYLKRLRPSFDVLLLDRNPSFVSCPMSNLWLADQVDLEFLSHSYLDAARNGGYGFMQAAVIDVDREQRRLYTESGYVDYDYLVLAPGIDYDYAKIGVNDPDAEQHIRLNYPAGFSQASEYLTLKRKLNEFKGGTLALNVPSGNYRCTAAPYERACIAAALFKKRSIKAKVLLLDANPDIKIKKTGFAKAFETLYGDTIEYQPSVNISGINLESKEVETDFDTYGFDDAIFYPPVRASRLIENLRLVDPLSLQKEAHIDPFKYHIVGDERVYVTGDSRPQPFSKSAHTSYTEARYVAEVIVGHADGKEVAWRSPQTMCFSGVRIDPVESMSIIAFYQYNEAEKAFAFDRSHPIENWSARGGQAGLAWAEGIYRDLFYS